MMIIHISLFWQVRKRIATCYNGEFLAIVDECWQLWMSGVGEKAMSSGNLLSSPLFFSSSSSLLIHLSIYVISVSPIKFICCLTCICPILQF